MRPMKTAMLSTIGLALAAVACDSGFTEWAAFSDRGDEVIFIVSTGPYDDQRFSVQIGGVQDDAVEDWVELHGDEKLDLVWAFLLTEGRATERALLVGYLQMWIYDGGTLVKTINFPQRVANVIPSYDGRYLYYSGDDRQTIVFDIETETEREIIIPNFSRDNDQIFWMPDGRLMIRGSIHGSGSPFLTTYAIRPGEEPVVDDTVPCVVKATGSWRFKGDGAELIGAKVPPTIYRGRDLRCP